MKRLLPLLLLAGCAAPSSGPNLKPVADSISFLGISFVLAALVLVVGHILRGPR
jgi:hypothetical protein